MEDAVELLTIRGVFTLPWNQYPALIDCRSHESFLASRIAHAAHAPALLDEAADLAASVKEVLRSIRLSCPPLDYFGRVTLLVPDEAVLGTDGAGSAGIAGLTSPRPDAISTSEVGLPMPLVTRLQALRAELEAQKVKVKRLSIVPASTVQAFLVAFPWMKDLRPSQVPPLPFCVLGCQAPPPAAGALPVSTPIARADFRHGTAALSATKTAATGGAGAAPPNAASPAALAPVTASSAGCACSGSTEPDAAGAASAAPAATAAAGGCSCGSSCSCEGRCEGGTCRCCSAADGKGCSGSSGCACGAASPAASVASSSSAASSAAASPPPIRVPGRRSSSVDESRDGAAGAAAPGDGPGPAAASAASGTGASASVSAAAAAADAAASAACGLDGAATATADADAADAGGELAGCGGCTPLRLGVGEGMLLLGGSEQAQARAVFDRLRVTRVVNCSVELPHYFEAGSPLRSIDTPTDIAYFRVPVHDQTAADLRPHIEGACDFIHTSLGEGRRVLVHCAQGLSRSAAIVIAYLIRHHGCAMGEADVSSGSGSAAGSAAGTPTSTSTSLPRGFASPVSSASPFAGMAGREVQTWRLQGPHSLEDYRMHGAAARPNRGFVEQLKELTAAQTQRRQASLRSPLSA